MEGNKNNFNELENGFENEFENELDNEEMLETITMTDDEGNETEFCIIDEINHNDITYLLVVETEHIEDDESEAAIFKEVEQEDDKIIYEEIDDDKEFEHIAGLFAKNRGEYELEM